MCQELLLTRIALTDAYFMTASWIDETLWFGHPGADHVLAFDVSKDMVGKAKSEVDKFLQAR